jgi:isochorismate synthase
VILEGDYKKTIKALFATAIRFNLPVAVWRLPNSPEVKLCVSLRSFQTMGSVPQVEGGLPGFAFYPFSVSNKNPAAFIKADITFSSLSAKLKFNFKLNGDPEYVDLVQRLQEYFEKVKDGAHAKHWHISKHTLPQATSRQNFKSLVQSGILAIEAHLFEKVVLSRARTEVISPDFDVIDAFCLLQETYSHAFISLVSVPDVGTWMGASPEVLVSVDRDKTFRTVALAGTQVLTQEVTPANALWRQKEIEEQALVERYIISYLKKIRLREFTEIGPRTVAAGNLMHLRTDFVVNMNEVPYPNLGTEMLGLLHPTSAVCGMPKEPATAFIRQYEGYDRGYYSGYLGPVQIDGESHIYVNLRCMQLFEQAALLYAGAGITAESEPEKEWLETDMKMDTVYRIIRKEA